MEGESVKDSTVPVFPAPSQAWRCAVALLPFIEGMDN